MIIILELNQIHLGDCLNIMKKINDDSIDLTITSPPYDNLRTYNNSLEWSFEVFKLIAGELFRITKPGGVIVWVVGDATIKGSETGASFRQALHFKDIGFNLHDTMIYEKDCCPFPETNRYYPYFEYMFILSKGKPKTHNLIADKPNKRYGEKVTGNAREKNGEVKQHNAVKRGLDRKIKEFGVRGNVWRYSVGKWKVTKDSIAYEHPAIFPEQLAHDHIITWSKEEDIVFDPFVGSGTTCKMAMLAGRNYIGIEKDEKYCEIAKSRILQHSNTNVLSD